MSKFLPEVSYAIHIFVGGDVRHAECGAGALRPGPKASREEAPWRGVGPQPCMGPPDVGAYKCPPAPEVVAVRAGHLFDSKTGRMLTNQVVLLLGERITDVGPQNQIKVPAGTRIIDLSQATVLPGLVDA